MMTTTAPENPADDSDEAVDHKNYFLQPIGSPSPGGSSTTAADDTDDDDFRDLVSADFIRPERDGVAAAAVLLSLRRVLLLGATVVFCFSPCEHPLDS